MIYLNEWKEYKKPKSEYYSKRINISKIDLDEICNLLNLKDDIKFIASGQYGNAYKVGNKVLKITSDIREAKSVYNIIGKNNPSIVKYYSINQYKIKNKLLFIIVMDYVKPLSSFLGKNYNYDFIDFILDKIYDNWKDLTHTYLISIVEDNWVGITKADYIIINKFFIFYKNIKKLNKDLDIHIENLGINNNKDIILFDFNEMSSINKFNKPDIIK